MDSGNSGSLQSSSGGDDEYDSRAAAVDSVSAFMSGGPISNPPPPPPIFDRLSSYTHLHHNSNSSLLDPNPTWPRITTLRSDPNPVSHDNLHALPSSSDFVSSFHPPPPPPQNQGHTAARNPKKRSRASRRAPTTILTTDTTNFRAMVQEFTGIPAPPFESLSFPRTRLGLFGSRSVDAPLTPYLRRPFAQPPLPFADGASSSSSTTNNHNQSSNPAINHQSSFQNPFLTNFLHTNPTFPLSDSMASKPGPFPRAQFGLSHANNNFIPSDQNPLQTDHNSKTDKDKDDREDGVNLKNGDYSFPSSTSNSKTSFHQRPENNVAGEGMVESWICSSE